MSLSRMWNHADCTLKKGNQIKAYVLPFYDHNLDWQRSLDDVEGIELLRWEDQEKIRKYVESGGPQNTPSAAVMEYGMEVSQTSRATCRRCNQMIMKGEVRISTKPDGRGGKGLAWHHANCFMELFPTTQVEKVSGWNNLSASDQAAVLALVKKHPSSRKDTKVEQHEDEESLHQLASKGGSKR
ncbi:Poly [ADP-ribose] polymerase [Actinidia chinensis var. chinensis]|uniref:Poly [ADP-ribose] polymerase n=1 Tax=Actinidia chinensis var. chinensis TaxID=1590841 RepID=A0A2R6PPA0_ACTCC|nr:Poly [ADP-ribose] polymerase [Actinidia chinensis var. chinensis]